LFDNARGLGHDVDSADEESEDDIAIMKKQMAKQASKSSSEPQAAATSTGSASRSGSSELSTVVTAVQGFEGASDSVGTTHDNPITNLDVQDNSIDVDHPRLSSRSFSPWPVEPPDSPGASTIAKGKRKQDVVPLERSVSPLTDIAEDASQVNMKKQKKSKTSTAEKATGSRKSTRYRK
jgi:hypothetical protein